MRHYSIDTVLLMQYNLYNIIYAVILKCGCSGLLVKGQCRDQQHDKHEGRQDVGGVYGGSSARIQLRGIDLDIGRLWVLNEGRWQCPVDVVAEVFIISVCMGSKQKQ